VQAEALQYSLQGKDVLVQSQTGTGKTAAFLVSLFQLMLTDKSEMRDQALVIAPTRELALQIEKEALLLGVHLGLSIGSFYGGTGYDKQERMLREGVDILIGTPGRLIDFARKGRINFAGMGFLVIDEADRLFDMGFYQDLRRMLRRMRKPQQRQTMLFSATLAFKAQLIASQHMNEPQSVTIAPEQVTVDNVHQELYHVGKREKMNLLLGLLKRETPSNSLFFVNRKFVAERLTKRLKVNGYACECLTGDIAQNKREERIERFKRGDLPFLVATDVASRGLHVEGLDLVVNYDLPEDTESYVHRIGRTARAGKSGKAITLACEEYVEALSSIEKYIGMKIPVAVADEELFVKDQSAGMDLRRPRRDGGGRGGRSSGSRRGGGSRGGGGSRRSSGSGRRAEGRSTSDRSGSRDDRSRSQRSSGKQQSRPHKHPNAHSRARKRQEQPVTPAQHQQQQQQQPPPRPPEKSTQPPHPNEGKPTLLARITGLFKRK
jgi:ATP-dependent RNA helicase RhlB